MLSALIITKNEEVVIGRCLASLNWADERVIIDCGSTDATCEIARSYGARVIHNDWPGYGAQRNFGRDQCRGDWILAIDADEEVTPGLARAIQALLARGPSHPVYKMRRQEVFLGKLLRFGASRECVTRLYRREFEWGNPLLHESLDLAGHKPGRLPGALLHYSWRDLHQWIVKNNQYSTIKAQQIQARGRPVSLATAVVHGVAGLLRQLLIKGGILDGWRGVVRALLSANGSLLAYAKAVELSSRAADLDSGSAPPASLGPSR